MGLAKKIEFIYNNKGERTDVILPIEKYEELVEDLADLQVIEERKKEKNIPYSEVKKRRRQRNA